MNKVISIKDWVPARVKTHFLTEDEVDTWNAEYNQSQLVQSDAVIALPVQETLSHETEDVNAAEPVPQK